MHKIIFSALQFFFTKNNHAGIFVKRHVAEVVKMAEISDISAASAICVIKNGVLIVREKWSCGDFLRTF